MPYKVRSFRCSNGGWTAVEEAAAVLSLREGRKVSRSQVMCLLLEHGQAWVVDAASSSLRPEEATPVHLPTRSLEVLDQAAGEHGLSRVQALEVLLSLGPSSVSKVLGRALEKQGQRARSEQASSRQQGR